MRQGAGTKRHRKRCRFEALPRGENFELKTPFEANQGQLWTNSGVRDRVRNATAVVVVLHNSAPANPKDADCTRNYYIIILYIGWLGAREL